MKLILSPSKTQDFESFLLPDGLEPTQPNFKKEIKTLVSKLKQLTPGQLSKLMSLSDNLTELNFSRFQEFQPTKFNQSNAKPALLAFQGDVYRDIDSENYTKSDWEFAEQTVRILSGLYGLLHPLDLIQPYRLEMKTKLKTDQAKDLYDFWQDTLANDLLSDMDKDEFLINLASNEYSKALLPFLDKDKVINIVFKDKKNDQYKVIAIYAKLARGTMTNLIVKNKIKDPEKIKDLNVDGYKFSSEDSTQNEYVFLRG